MAKTESSKTALEPPVTDRTQVTLRLPPTLREALALAAFSNNRSVNAEIIARLERSLGMDDRLTELTDLVTSLQEQVDAIDATTDKRLDRLESDVLRLREISGDYDPNGWKD